LPREITSPGDDLGKNDEDHYRQYDHIETAIGEANLTRDYGVLKTVESPSGVNGTADPALRNEDHHPAVEGYIRNTVPNLSQLALGLGMSKARFAELITEGMNI